LINEKYRGFTAKNLGEEQHQHIQTRFVKKMTPNIAISILSNEAPSYDANH
jgi:hypothetical protein